MKYFILLCIGLFSTWTFALGFSEPEGVMDILLLLSQSGGLNLQSYAIGFVGFLILITFCIKLLFMKSEEAKEWIPMMTAILGAMTGAGASVASGTGDPIAGALGGMLLGNSASGFYDAAVKPIKKRIQNDAK